MSAPVWLLGLDFGSTTSSALVARARLARHAVSGRSVLDEPTLVYQPPAVFTPFRADDSLDVDAVAALVDRWLAESGVTRDAVFAGGAIVTGLAARQGNAEALTRLVTERLGEALVATADDPCLESWIAFMGNLGILSRHHAGQPILNLDIGGGTTNPALGVDSSVLATGCYWVGARHLRFEPGSYRLTAVSQPGRTLLELLEVDARIGHTLAEPQLERVLSHAVRALEAIASGDRGFLDSALGAPLEQVRFSAPTSAPWLLAFSGGVGELVYRLAAGGTLPGTTHYGDLGIDLARRIVASPVLSRDLRRLVPEHGGRATVAGLTLHHTEVSGSTLYLPRPGLLPLRDLPVVARLRADADADALCQALALAARRRAGACVQLLPRPGAATRAQVKALGERLGQALDQTRYPADRPLVLLTSDDAGKTLGSYATDWGRRLVTLIVIDELPDRGAHFANVGRVRENLVPVSFYGLRQEDR